MGHRPGEVQQVTTYFKAFYADLQAADQADRSQGRDGWLCCSKKAAPRAFLLYSLASKTLRYWSRRLVRTEPHWLHAA